MGSLIRRLGSSLVRHSKRCLQALKAPPRQKACENCVNAKLRCDLQRPICGRCQNRTVHCEYRQNESPLIPVATNEAQSTFATSKRQNPPINRLGRDAKGLTNNGAKSCLTACLSTSTFDTQQLQSGSPINVDRRTYSFTPNPSLSTLDNLVESDSSQHTSNIQQIDAHSLEPDASLFPEPLELMISDNRRTVLLGTAHSRSSHGIIIRHTAHFVTRVLRSWLRMMATQHTSNLPPLIHALQLTESTPIPLANCYTLVKMWASHTKGSHELIQSTVYKEVRRLLQEVSV